MTDYTREILALQRARVEMQAAKKLAEVEVKEQYATRIRDEIKRRTEQAELDFAHELAEAVKSGIPQSVIRSEVLRTNVWSRWTYWRDLAEIEPERVVVANARKARSEADRPYRWDDDFTELTVLSVNGERLENPFYVLDWGVGERGATVSYPDELMWAIKRAGFQFADIDAVAKSALEEAYSDKLIPESLTGYEALRSGEIDSSQYVQLGEIIMERNSAWL